MAEPSPWQQVGGSAAEVYERLLVPAMFAPWAPVLLDAAAVGSGDRVLDVACGTGVVARLAAERVGTAGRVVGLDVNAAMLTVARALPPPSGAVIEWCEASALQMLLPDAAFDVVLCQQGLQQFSDRPAALREMRRVLRPAGRLAACVWGKIEQNPGMAALVQALERHVGAAAANNRRAPFALDDADALRFLVEGAGFSAVTIRTMSLLARFPSAQTFVDAQLSATPLSTLGGVTAEAHAAVVNDVRAALRAFLTDDILTVPMEAHVVVAHAPS
jgi:ubiquinone/menaquinone biosynthesis C-methylase UbiE